MLNIYLSCLLMFSKISYGQLWFVFAYFLKFTNSGDFVGTFLLSVWHKGYPCRDGKGSQPHTKKIKQIVALPSQHLQHFNTWFVYLYVSCRLNVDHNSEDVHAVKDSFAVADQSYVKYVRFYSLVLEYSYDLLSMLLGILTWNNLRVSF